MAERLAQTRHDARSDQAGVGGPAQALQDQRELVAPEARYRVLLAAALPETPRHLAQKRVPGIVAEGVVDGLERIEVEQHQRHGLVAAPAAADRMSEAVLEPPSVRQAGQSIMVGEVAHALLGALALGDVDVDAHQADNPTIRLHGRQDRLDVPPPLASAVAGLIAQGIAGKDPSVGLLP